LGDIGGLRPRLGSVGITLGLAETSEVLGNVTGGIRRGAAYDGLTQMTLGLDTSKASGWDGGTFNISALQIHGRNLSTDNLATLQTASGIEANRATRLWEAWYQQAFAGGAYDVKVGQQSIDQEFLISQGSSVFINTAMGWPLVPSVDQYAGAPAYPLSSLGVRLRAKPTDAITILGGVFDDNPPGGPFANDSQVRGAEQSGTRFNTGTGALFIAELQFALNPPPAAAAPGETAAQPTASTGLPGTYKLGFWYDSGAFPDQRIAQNGLLLANPANPGTARMRHGNYSVYGVADQVIWRPTPDGGQAVGVFARAMGAPDDRNLVNFALNAGVTLKAPLPGRDNDTLGLGYGYGHISGSASAYASDLGQYTGTQVPSRSSESFLELTYQAQVAPWWIVQPDMQYVFRPAGGVPNPLVPTQRVKDEFVLGVRTNITF
jgi:porin